MLKHLILLVYLLNFSLQIEHCLKHINLCKKCNLNSFYIQTPSMTYCSKINHCIYISDNEQTCQECMDAYEKTTGGQCEQRFELIENCREYSSNSLNYEDSICTKCNRGYALSWDKKKCVKFPNCKKLSQDTSKCYECDRPYQLNSEGKCKVSTCDSFSNGTCINCVDGFYLDSNGNCKQIPIAYCQKWDSNACLTCNDVSKLVNGTCVLQDFIVECEEYSPGTKDCVRCHQGYSFNDDRTKCELKYCLEEEQLCYQCEDGYFSKGTTCNSYDGSDEEDSSSFILNYSFIIFGLFLIL